MPELPEVETTCRGIEPHIKQRTISDVVVRDNRLRWPIPHSVTQARGQTIQAVKRRAKYILLELQQGGLLIHLGMTGSLRIVQADDLPQKHDHFDVTLDNGMCLRFNDPRRFGAFLWWDSPAEAHPLLSELGPEPLSSDFTADYLWQRSRGRKLAVKSFVMDGKVVVGVGNIYASESLYMAGIHPTRAAGRISKDRYHNLVVAIQDVLSRAIKQGGTTIKDFVQSDGMPGYFAQELLVYDRQDQPCFQCKSPIKHRVIGQRSSYYCGQCQR